MPEVRLYETDWSIEKEGKIHVGVFDCKEASGSNEMGEV